MKSESNSLAPLFGTPMAQLDNIMLTTFGKLKEVEQIEKPKLADLLKILRDPAFFWEAFSLDGIDDRCANSDTNFMFDIMESLESQDHAEFGLRVSNMMLEYAERIHELRQ